MIGSVGIAKGDPPIRESWSKSLNREQDRIKWKRLVSI
jgi:hypothetical protein